MNERRRLDRAGNTGGDLDTRSYPNLALRRLKGVSMNLPTTTPGWIGFGLMLVVAACIFVAMIVLFFCDPD